MGFRPDSCPFGSCTVLATTGAVRNRLFRTSLVAAAAIWLACAPISLAGAEDDTAALEAAAIRELLEGSSGRREAWSETPGLLVLENVMEFTGPSMAGGYSATRDKLSGTDVDEIVSELTAALALLTGGSSTTFSAVEVESLTAGERVSVFRPGFIVVGRYRDVLKKAGTLGFGGRMTRRGSISAASVVLDSQFDRKDSRRRLLRTHELGHALGFNHVESRPSVMNPVVGSDVTPFDRTAIRIAFGGPEPAARAALAAFRLQLPLLN
jgi:hypothetical protein